MKCPTCGPTATERHPRRNDVTRCANCKEWLSAEQTPDIETAMRDVRAAVWNMCDQIIADHPMWIGNDGKPLDYLPQREARIGDFVREAGDAIRAHLAEVAGRDEVREAMGKALAARTYANDEPVEWAIEDWIRDADAAVGAYLRAIGGGK